MGAVRGRSVRARIREGLRRAAELLVEYLAYEEGFDSTKDMSKRLFTADRTVRDLPVAARNDSADTAQQQLTYKQLTNTRTTTH